MRKKYWILPYVLVFQDKFKKRLNQKMIKDISRKLHSELNQYLKIRIAENKSQQETLFRLFMGVMS